MGKSKHSKRGQDLRRVNGSEDYRNALVAGVVGLPVELLTVKASALLESSSTPTVVAEIVEVPALVRQEQSLETIKASLRERIARAKSGQSSDEELVQLVIEGMLVIPESQRELDLLKKDKTKMDPLLFEMATKTLQDQVDSARRELAEAIAQRPRVARIASERMQLSRIAKTLTEQLPKEIENSAMGLRAAQTILGQVLDTALAEELFFSPPTNATVRERDPMLIKGKFYAAKSKQEDVLFLFDCCANFLAVVREVQQYLDDEEAKEASRFVVSEEKLRQSGEEVVSFYDLLLRHDGRKDRLALVPLFDFPGQHLGMQDKIAIRRTNTGNFVIYQATSSLAAELTMKIPVKSRATGEIEWAWVEERYLKIALDSKARTADFSQIGFEPLRKTFAREFRRNVEFARELASQQEITASATISVGELLANTAGVCSIWANLRERRLIVVFSLESDGQGNTRVVQTSLASGKEMPLLAKHTQWEKIEDAMQDKGFCNLIRLGEESEISRKAFELRQQKNLLNLSDEDTLKAFLTKTPGRYFWFLHQHQNNEKRPINAILEVKEGKVSVVETVGRFAKEFFGELIKPVALQLINGRVRQALKRLAETKLQPEEIPDFLKQPTL